ncbi:hypothetical protein I4U23_016600 [Adineta vaga]|nr:hypothetical protein I4U23_016600 [Adineta vaga]
MARELLDLEPLKETCENMVEENNREPILSSVADQNNQEERQHEFNNDDDDVSLLSNHSNQGVVIRKSSVLTDKRVLIGCNIVLLSIILLIILIKISNHSLFINLQSSTISDTTTTKVTIMLNQSSTTTMGAITFSPQSCPIPSVNATWNKPGVVVVNQLGRCLSNENSLCNPIDFFIDDIHDTLYVADTNNNRIQKYSLNEIYNNEVGATGITVASKGLVSPQSIFVDINTEDMYIMDLDQKQIRSPVNSLSYRVHLWKKNEKVGRILFREAGEYLFGRYFHHLTLDKEMNIYVGTRYFIKKWLKSTNYTAKVIVAGKNHFNLNGSTDLSDPVAFYVTDDLTLYIADWNNKRIQRWEVNATNGTTVIGNLTYVTGITMDCNGYLYYAEMYDSTIYQLNMKTNQSQMIVRNEDNLGKLIYYWPSAIKIDKFGNIFAMGNDQVYKFSIVKK